MACALFLTMICSAMFYKTETDVERPSVIQLGPITITTQELYVSCVTAAIVFPVTLFITMVFRNSNTETSPKEWRNREGNGPEYELKEYDDISELLGELHSDPEVYGYSKKESEGRTRWKELLNKVLLIMAWTLANLGVICSAFFVILYSMQWGAKKANAWLVSFLLSVVQNAFLADPIKVSSPPVPLCLHLFTTPKVYFRPFHVQYVT